MSKGRDDRVRRHDDEVDALVAEAFTSRGELLPTTDEEVARAEQRGVSFEGDLPESLHAFEPSRETPASGTAADPTRHDRDDKVTSLDEVRAKRAPPTWSGYVTAGVLGAAAASLFWIWFGSATDEVTPLPALDPGTPSASTSAQPPPIAVGPVRRCEKPCCAGTECAAAEPPLDSCSSGRACIPCSVDLLRGSLYRLRLGGLRLSPTAQELGEKHKWGLLELCVDAGSAAPSCVAAHAGAGNDDVWTSLPSAVSAQNLVGGLTVRVRTRATRAVIATWKHPVVTNPTLLCRGLTVSPKLKGGESIGSLSVFLEDAHFVEIARSGEVGPLDSLGQRIAFADVTPKVYETTKPEGARFALVVGPLDKPTAERLRWKLLEANVEAGITLGDDHKGAPREVKRD